VERLVVHRQHAAAKGAAELCFAWVRRGAHPQARILYTGASHMSRSRAVPRRAVSM
jgi:hypothetical protein